MQDVEQLMEKARELGEHIASHERVKAYFAAQNAIKANAEAQAILKDYAKHMERLRELEAKQQPIEVADKQKAAELERQIAGNDLLKELMRVQADYVQLMNQVNHAMSAPMSGLAQPEEPA